MELSEQFLPSLLIVLITMVFFIAERIFPGRELPHVKGWYARAALINLVQLSMMGLAGVTWNTYFRSHTVFDLGQWNSPVVEGLFYYFIGTFIFYWWHRLRHASGWWRVFHQVHHSASRIEVLTSFYKHPVEIATNSVISGLYIYCLLGGSAEAGAWYALFAAAGEYFYHANIKVPHWVGFVIQTPELHSIHHQLDVHNYNFGDITWWDRLFGTFKDTDSFSAQCGFPRDNERHMGDMLVFRDVYDRP